MSIDASYSEVAILSRVIHSAGPLTPQAARALMELDFPPEDQERMRELSARMAEGKLSPQERAEMQSYNRVTQILALLQAKARQALNKA